MNVPAITSRESVASLALPLAVVFVMSMGYGVVLPVLPFMLARVLGEAARAEVAWHTGLLTGVYMLALFMFAPLWGRISDRVGRRMVILLGLAGFSGAMLWFALARGLVFVYGARVLAGVFAAAVLPVIFAWVSDVCTPRTRAQAFAWLSAASALGFLFGPALSGWLASAKVVASDDAPALPFYAAALLSGAVWLVAYRFFPESVSRRAGSESESMAPSLLWPLALSLLVMLGLGGYEVSLTLQGKQVLNLEPRGIGWMFAECSLVMILVQVFVRAPLLQRAGSRLLAPAFLAMAIGVALLPYAASYPVMLIGVGLVAASAGILIPALVYLVSLAAGAQQGAAIGRQTAAANLGQAVGSVAAGGLFAVHIEMPFWVIAALLGLGAVAALHVSNTMNRFFEVSSERETHE